MDASSPVIAPGRQARRRFLHPATGPVETDGSARAAGLLARVL